MDYQEGNVIFSEEELNIIIQDLELGLHDYICHIGNSRKWDDVDQKVFNLSLWGWRKCLCTIVQRDVDGRKALHRYREDDLAYFYRDWKAGLVKQYKEDIYGELNESK